MAAIRMVAHVAISLDEATRVSIDGERYVTLTFEADDGGVLDIQAPVNVMRQHFREALRLIENRLTE